MWLLKSPPPPIVLISLYKYKTKGKKFPYDNKRMHSQQNHPYLLAGFRWQYIFWWKTLEVWKRTKAELTNQSTSQTDSSLRFTSLILLRKHEVGVTFPPYGLNSLVAKFSAFLGPTFSLCHHKDSSCLRMQTYVCNPPVVMLITVYVTVCDGNNCDRGRDRQAVKADVRRTCRNHNA